MNPELSGSDEQFERLRKILLPIFADAAIGDFSRDVPIMPGSQQDFNQLLMGVQVMLEVIRQQQRELEEAQAMVTDVQVRTSEILARVVARDYLPDEMPDRPGRRG